MRKEINGVTANYIYRTVRYQCSSLSDSVERDRAANEYIRDDDIRRCCYGRRDGGAHSRSRYCNVSYLILLNSSRACASFFIYESCNLKSREPLVPGKGLRALPNERVDQKKLVDRRFQGIATAWVFVGPGWWRPTHNPDRLKFRRYLFCSFTVYFYDDASENLTRHGIYVGFDSRWFSTFRFPTRRKYPSSRTKEMYLNRWISLSTLFIPLSLLRFFSVSLTSRIFLETSRLKGKKFILQV